MKTLRYLLCTTLLATTISVVMAAPKETKSVVSSTKQERNLINEGNKLYNQQRFAEAEVLYRKALQVNPSSEFAGYNLATSLIRQVGTTDVNKGNTPLSEAISLLENLKENAKNNVIVEKASYNLGNISFNNNDFQSSIDFYKNALRQNPSNDKARQNLRLAQKKLQEQQNNNQDQNKDKNQEKDQNKEQDKQDKNKPENNQNQDQDNKQDNKNDDQNKKQPEPQNVISDANAEKILKAMEDEEAATRKKIEAQRKKMGQAQRRQPKKPW